MRKTIKSLMSKKKVVYVRLSTPQVAEVFFALAKYEGFKLSEDMARKEKHENCYIRLNEDMTLTYPGYRTWGGAMKFRYSQIEDGKKVVKVDFEELLGKN